MQPTRPQQDQLEPGALQARRREQVAAMFEISRAFSDVPDKELERELARAQAEARAELRAEHNDTVR
jgi:hypothetical protein